MYYLNINAQKFTNKKITDTNSRHHNMHTATVSSKWNHTKA